MKKLLVTGGRGFIGRYCLDPALSAGYEVHATTTSMSTVLPSTSDPVCWHEVDLLAEGAIQQLLAQVRPTHVLHTAWETTHGSYWTSPANLRWLGLATSFLPAFVQHGGRRFVSTGSCAEYDWSSGIIHEGVTAEEPTTFYGRVKLAHHSILMASAEQLGFSAATGRIFFGYGPYENAARIIPYVCQQLATGVPAKISNGNLQRDFMHVTDIGRGLVALVESEISGACNVSSGEAVSLASIASRLGEIAGGPDLIHIESGPCSARSPLILLGKNKILSHTKWKPLVTLSDGLEETFHWWKNTRG